VGEVSDVSDVIREYEYIEHTADIGIKVYGLELKDLFANAAKAFLDILTEPESIQPSLKKQIIVESRGWERLLVTWLSELLYLFEVNQWLFQKCEIQSLDENRVEAVCWGEHYDPDRHEIKTGIKAVTYHQLSVQRVNDLWEATIIFDV
jgi:SHS2 domain-containing protein